MHSGVAAAPAGRAQAGLLPVEQHQQAQRLLRSQRRSCVDERCHVPGKGVLGGGPHRCACTPSCSGGDGLHAVRRCGDAGCCDRQDPCPRRSAPLPRPLPTPTGQGSGQGVAVSVGPALLGSAGRVVVGPLGRDERFSCQPRGLAGRLLGDLRLLERLLGRGQGCLSEDQGCSRAGSAVTSGGLPAVVSLARRSRGPTFATPPGRAAAGAGPAAQRPVR